MKENGEIVKIQKAVLLEEFVLLGGEGEEFIDEKRVLGEGKGLKL